MQRLGYSACILLMSSSKLTAQEEMIERNEWASSDVHFALVGYQDQSRSIKSFQIIISNDHEGKQILELRAYNSNTELCAFYANNGRAVMEIDGQSVTMKVSCVSHGNFDSFIYHAGTDEGHDHIVDSFLSNEYVPVNMQGYEVKFPTAGFKAAWDGFEAARDDFDINPN